ncbi:Uncharacterised protein [Bordetella pertussis]|nr:Uncharacterised protein [Bordetella pertussis]
MRSHMRDSGPFRSCGSPDSSVRRTESDSASASSMALKRSPSTRVSCGPEGSTRWGWPAASWSAASARRVSGRVMCHENQAASSSTSPIPPTQNAINGVATGGSRRSSGMTSHSRSGGASSGEGLGASEMKISGRGPRDSATRVPSLRRSLSSLTRPRRSRRMSSGGGWRRSYSRRIRSRSASSSWGPRCQRCSRASAGSERDQSRHWLPEAWRTNSARSSVGTCDSEARKVRMVGAM